MSRHRNVGSWVAETYDQDDNDAYGEDGPDTLPINAYVRGTFEIPMQITTVLALESSANVVRSGSVLVLRGGRQPALLPRSSNMRLS